MKTIPISDSAYTVYITAQDMEERRISPASLNLDEAIALVRDARGDLSEGARLEVYTRGGDVLIFVWSQEPEFFLFGTLEELLSALEALPGAGGTVYLLEGDYILCLWASRELCRRASEFSRPLDLPGSFLWHLKEHGKRLGSAQELLSIANFPF